MMTKQEQIEQVKRNIGGAERILTMWREFLKGLEESDGPAPTPPAPESYVPTDEQLERKWYHSHFESKPPEAELTEEQAAMLERANHGLAIKLDDFSGEHLVFMRTLHEAGMIEWILFGCYWHITDAGRAALAAHEGKEGESS